MHKKVWHKPEVKKIVAGSAEGGSTQNRVDRSTTGNPNRS